MVLFESELAPGLLLVWLTMLTVCRDKLSKVSGGQVVFMGDGNSQPFTCDRAKLELERAKLDAAVPHPFGFMQRFANWMVTRAQGAADRACGK
jgi:hypothetical protein